MNCQGMAAWYYQADGLKLWEEGYAAFNLVPRPALWVAPQMAGWFRKKINSIGDFKGLKMRIPNLGGQVVARAGGTTVLTPGGEIYAALERGVIDASEFVGPHDDMKLGLHKTARYYYYPGLARARHRERVRLQQESVRGAAGRPPADPRPCRRRRAIYGLTDYHTKNAIALERLKTEFKGKVEILQLPVPVLHDLKKLSVEVVREDSKKTPMARKVHASFTKFQALVGPWDHVAEGAYHRFVAS